MQVEGWVARGYEPVRTAVRRCGPGVTVAALVEGRPVVDVWTTDLREDALLCTWSAIKPVTGACLLLLVERKVIGLADPVCSVWPELGDDRLRIRHLLTHTAGRITVPPVPLTDWPASIAALAAAPADWPPGTVICEHALTFGHLIGEVLRRLDGRTLGRFLAEELAGPHGWDLQIGVRETDLSRVATAVGADRAWWDRHGGPAGSPADRALGPWFDVNDPVWRRAQVPAVNGHATARDLARFWQAFLDNRLPAGVGQPGATGRDLFIGEPVTWTLAGGLLDGWDVGMGGLGGQWAAARPADGLAWAFLTTHAADQQRAQFVEDALLGCLRDLR